MIEINKVLDSNEKVLWQGKPDFLPYFLSVIPAVVFGLPFLVLGGFVGYMVIKSGNYLVMLMPHFWIGFLITFGVPLYYYLVYKNVYYFITDKRIMLQSGLIGRDFEMIDFDQITNAEVNVGIFDKLSRRNTGSIYVSSAGTFVGGKKGPMSRPYSISSVVDPYEVFKFIKKVSFDVKTDIEYPNKMRPVDNPGYQTDYQVK